MIVEGIKDVKIEKDVCKEALWKKLRASRIAEREELSHSTVSSEVANMKIYPSGKVFEYFYVSSTFRASVAIATSVKH